VEDLLVLVNLVTDLHAIRVILSDMDLHGNRVIMADMDLHYIIQATHVDDVAVDLKEG
jgi:hypothetical protein